MAEIGDETNAEREIKPCLACFAPNDIDAAVCSECGARFGNSNVLQPLNVGRAEAGLYQDLAFGEKGAKRPKFVILLGVWVMFLPLFGIGVTMIIYQILALHGFSSFIFICFGAATAYFSLILLGSVTKRYFKPQE